MGGKNYFKNGDWNALCDICGQRFKASEIRLQWDNARVCWKCWSPRHPQELQLPQPVPATPSWTRPLVLNFEEISTVRVIDASMLDQITMG